MGHWQRGLLFFFVIATICSAPCLGEQNAVDKKWTLSFKNAPVSQVLDELTRVTGINIFANQIPEGKTVNKSYKDQTIDQIVRDLYRGTSFALVWKYEQSGPGSLDIRVFDGDSSNAPRSYTPVGREFPTISNPPVRGALGRPNVPEDGEDAEGGAEIPESEEPEVNEPPTLPTGNDESAQDEASEKAGGPRIPARAIPQHEGADKGGPDDE